MARELSQLQIDIILGSTWILALLAVVGVIMGPMFWGVRAYTDAEIERFQTEGILTDAYLIGKRKRDFFLDDINDYYVSFYYHDPSLPDAEGGSKYNSRADDVRIYFALWDEFNITKDEFFKVYFIDNGDDPPQFLLEKETDPEYMTYGDQNSWGKPLTIGSIVYLVLFFIFMWIWMKYIRKIPEYKREDYSGMV